MLGNAKKSLDVSTAVAWAQKFGTVEVTRGSRPGVTGVLVRSPPLRCSERTVTVTAATQNVRPYRSIK